MPGGNGWFDRNSLSFARGVEVIFGAIWGIDGTLKFVPGVVQAFPQMLRQASSGQPQWLLGWFSFWSGAGAVHPALLVYSVGLLELALAFSLIFGFMRRIGYPGGVLLSLLIWSVPEGLGGPYGPGSTDIGTGIIYAIAFLMLIALNAACGSGRPSLDGAIAKRVKWWKKLAEF